MAAANQGYDHDIEKPYCRICFGEFKAPRQLPCQHSFCQGCLEEYISSKAAKKKELKEFQCPICSSMIFIPRKGKKSEMFASLYPIDSLLLSIENKDEVYRPRDCYASDGISVTANGFCIVCEEAMCETCLKVHQKQKVSKDHSIVTIESITNKRENIINFQKGFTCREHEGKNLKFYCRDHQIACCSSCCIVHHRHCEKVSDIAKDAKTLLEELKPVRVLEEMKKLENHLINFEKKNDSNIANLESQVQDMANKLQEIKEKINCLLDDLERKVKSEGNELYKNEVIRTQKENRACQALLNAVRNSHMSLEKVMKHGSDKEIFITADSMISQVKLYYNQINETFNATEAVILSLEIGPQIKRILSQQYYIGRLIQREERANLPIARTEKPYRQYKFEMEETVKIKGPDEKNPFYTGFTYLQVDEVMLADCNNKRVILLNSTYQYLSSLTLQQHPCDICVVDHMKVAVSLPKNKTLQFLSVLGGTIKPTRTVQTRYECCGISEERRGKIVVSGNCSDKGRHYWGLITSTGEMEKCYHFDCQCDPSETYVVLNSSCTRVYMTIFMAKSLYCFDMNGSKMCVYSPDNFRYTRGVAIDSDDNVYVVVGCIFDNIHQLTSYCTPISVNTVCITETAHSISFNNNRAKFVIITFPCESRTLWIFGFK